ncbi:MAG: hypothetical protein LC790_03735, partial [Actinobacteria bacterium]|nr:hypothetical protein [Actinomycetota bacterium]
QGDYRALRPPPELRGAHKALLRTDREGDALLKRLVRELEGGTDPTKAVTRAAPQLGRVVGNTNLQARRLKVRDCVVDLNQFSEPSRSSS